MNINTHFTLRRGIPLFLFVSLFFAGLGLLLAWPSPAAAQEPIVELAADIAPGSTGSNPARFVVYNGKLYFQANDGTHGYELWVYDGSSASMVADIYSGSSASSPFYLTVYNGKLYFQASDSNYGSELWSYDGTDVALVQNIAIGINGSNPHDLEVYNGKLYFVADDRIHGSELWIYDGSTASLVEDIRPGSDGSFPQFLTVYDDKLYFEAWDGSTGYELWSYDGTHTVLTDINPGSTGSSPQSLVIYDSKLYFSAIDSTYGQELWVYDGANASLVQDINPGGNSSPGSLAVYDDKLYFYADDGTHGDELWIYDGSTAVRAQTITPYSNWTHSRPLAFHNDQLYLTADDGTHGYELWIYDGSTASMAADIYLGSSSSSPNFPAVYNNKLYFSAYDGYHGNELWRLGYPSLEVSQTVDDATADPGQLLTYQVVVNNGTLITQTNMVISDTLPAELTLAGPVNLVGGSGTAAQDSGDLPTLVENLNLLPGQVVTVTFPVTVSINASGNLSLVNTVAVTSSEVSDWRTAVVVVTVNSFPPVITEGVSTTVTMNRNGNPIPFDLTLHASDQNVSDTLTWSIDTQASHGTAVAAGTGLTKTIDYTPTADYIGSDSFIVQVSDGSLADSVTVNVSVKEPACVPSATSGVWSVVFSHCVLGEKHLIPDGYSVTLDVDINLAGNFEIESGGSFDPNGKTMILTGSAAQTLMGNPLTFYRLTLQKDNPTDTVTIDGKLKVSRKLRIQTGKLISASDYEDVEIESDGELQLTSDITISGHFTNSGTLDTNGYGLIFDGAKAQNLTLDSFTSFDDLTVMTGTTLIETIPDDNAFVNGNLTNYGSISKSQIVDSGESFYYFGLAGTYNGADIEMEIPGGDQGSLSAIQVERIDANHPNAPAQVMSDLYWRITPTGSGYSATLTLPHNGVTDPLACRYESSTWDCAADDADVDIVTRVGVTTFADWAVYGNQVLAMDDTAVTSEEAAVTISPLANDSILGGGSPTLTGVGIPRHGTAVISGTTQVVYTPTVNYAGSDVFTYAAGTGSLTGTGTITVTVQGVNDAPQVMDISITFLAKWGSSGSGDGQISYPYDTAVDSSGNVYVADSSNNRIQKFDSSGTYLSQWGGYGSGDGQFKSPYGVAVDSSGNVYVADTSNDRIQKFDSSGSFLTKWGSSGSGDGQFSYPGGVAVDSSGYVYVVDTVYGLIQKFDSSGSFLTKWGSNGSGNGQFNQPRGIAADSSGNVYVADTGNNRIQKFDSSGTYLSQWGGYGSGDGQLNYPNGVAVDSNGYVFVADSIDRIQKFSSSGTFITKWGSNGSGDGQFKSPKGMAVDSSGNIYVADNSNHRIQKFDTGGLISETSVTMSEDGNPTPFDLNLNAYDVDGDPITWSIDTQASHGTAVAAGTGISQTISYTPTADYNGSDSFIVHVSDSSLTSVVTVNVTIENVNDEPVITEGISTTVTMSRNGNPTPFDLTLHASDPDVSDTLTWSIDTPASHGTAVAAGTGISQTISYTPTADYNGSDSFIVQVSDGSLTDSVTVNVSVKELVCVPSATTGVWSVVFSHCALGEKYLIPDGYSVTLDININLDVDLEIEPGGTLDATTDRKTVTLTGGSNQTLTGDFTFYRLTIDKDTDTDTVTINGSLKVQSKMRIRTGELISASQYEDIDIETDGTLSLTNVISVSGNVAITGTLNTNGWGIVFNGAKEQALTLNTFTTFDDITVLTDTTLIETVPDDNSRVDGIVTNYSIIRKSQPVSSADFYYFGMAGAYPDYDAYGLEIEVTDLTGGDPLTVIQVDRIDKAHPNAPPKATDIYWRITPTGSDFTATVTLPYTNVTNPLACRYTGSSWNCANDDADVDYVTYADTTTFSDWAVFEAQPVAVDDTATTNEDSAITISPLTNDTSLGNDTLSISTVGSPANGTAVIIGTTQVVYTPTLNFAGSDVFTYTAADGNLTDTATITVTVNNINDAPVITDSTPISVTMSEDSDPNPFNLILHATDTEDDTLSWSISSQAGHGTATASGTGISKTIAYIPTANYTGSDSFIVQISDGSLTDTVTVSVTVKSVNDAPLAVDDEVMVRRGDQGDLSILGATQPVTLSVLSNDSDPDTPSDNSDLTLKAVGVTSHGGNANINTNQRLIDYTPAATFIGTETFSYTVSDKDGLTATAMVSVTVVNGDGGGSTDPGDSKGETIVIPATGLSQTITVTVQIPAGVATDTLALVYNAVDKPSGVPPKGYVVAGLVFTLDAYLSQQLQSGYIFSTPISLTIEYSDADVAGLSGGESSLELRYWNGSAWSSDGITQLSQDTANNRIVFQLEHLSEFALFGPDQRVTYLPVVMNTVATGPDLVVESVNATASAVTIVIRNTGNAPVNNPFWVDVYANPTNPPGLNQPWDTIAEAGAVWGVTKSLAPGESLTLTRGDAYYVATSSSASIPAGATVYALVDSVNYNTTYGNVAESDESNNLGGPVAATGGGSPPAIDPAAAPNLNGLPKR